MSSITSMRPPGTSRRFGLGQHRARVLVGQVVQQAEDQDLVEAIRPGRSSLRASPHDEARPGGASRACVDVARVEVGADVVVAGEQVGEGAGAAAEVERAQALLEAQLAADERADRLEVVLEDAAEEDEEDGVVGDALDQAREESH